MFLSLQLIGRASFQQEPLLSHCHLPTAVSGYHNNGEVVLHSPAVHDVRDVDLDPIRFRFLKACVDIL